MERPSLYWYNSTCASKGLHTVHLEMNSGQSWKDVHGNSLHETELCNHDTELHGTHCYGEYTIGIGSWLCSWQFRWKFTPRENKEELTVLMNTTMAQAKSSGDKITIALKLKSTAKQARNQCMSSQQDSGSAKDDLDLLAAGTSMGHRSTVDNYTTWLRWYRIHNCSRVWLPSATGRFR